MSSHMSSIAGLDLEDLTPAQLRKLLRSMACSGSMKQDQKEKDEEADEAAEENEKLVSLDEETKGKSKAPPVAEDDLPEEIAERKTKTKKKGS